MRITKVSLRNFKSIGDDIQEFPVAPITLLLGPNSVGKSTVLHALIYLREILSNRNRDPDRTEVGGEYLDLGGFRNLVHKHNLDATMEIGIEFDAGNERLPEFLNKYERLILDRAELPPPDKWIKSVKIFSVFLSLEWCKENNRVLIRNCKTGFNGEGIASITRWHDEHPLRFFVHEHHPCLTEPPEPFSGHEFAITELLFSAIKPGISLMSSDDFLVNSIVKQFDNQNELEEFINNVKDAFQDNLNSSKKNKVRKFKKVKDECYKAGLHGYGEKTLLQDDALPSLSEKLQLDDSIWRKEPIGRAATSPLEIRLLITSLLSTLIIAPLLLIEKYLREAVYIGPLRESPNRTITERKTFQSSRWARGLAGWDLLFNMTNNELSLVNQLIGSNGLKLKYKIERNDYYEVSANNPELLNKRGTKSELKRSVKSSQLKRQILLIDTDRGIPVSSPDVGTGISQVLPIVVAAAMTSNSLLLLEQPELHLHPAAQAELGDVFLKDLDLKNNQYFIETHSEYVVLRLLKRIRQTSARETPDGKPTLNADQVAILYVEESDFGAKVRHIRVDETGGFLDRWPRGFFAERRLELI